MMGALTTMNRPASLASGHVHCQPVISVTAECVHVSVCTQHAFVSISAVRLFRCASNSGNI
jgi:hypothetical protein